MKAGEEKAGTWKAWTKIRFSGLAAGLTAVLVLISGSQAAFANTQTSTASHTTHHHYVASRHVTHHSHYAAVSHHGRIHYAHYYYHGHHHALRYASAHYRYSRLQCVPYAREVSHIQLSGDAFLWWAEASGRYARGSTPVEGAVLNFRSIRRMPLGHVAVVTSVVDSRTILVTQANWVRGTITNDVTMQDVSPNNDWTQVQVELGNGSRWGAAYPTYGFIYNQPANSMVYASNSGQGDEVAEAPRPAPIMTEAPDRNLQ